MCLRASRPCHVLVDLIHVQGSKLVCITTSTFLCVFMYSPIWANRWRLRKKGSKASHSAALAMEDLTTASSTVDEAPSRRQAGSASDFARLETLRYQIALSEHKTRK